MQWRGIGKLHCNVSIRSLELPPHTYMNGCFVVAGRCAKHRSGKSPSSEVPVLCRACQRSSGGEHLVLTHSSVSIARSLSTLPQFDIIIQAQLKSKSRIRCELQAVASLDSVHSGRLYWFSQQLKNVLRKSLCCGLCAEVKGIGAGEAEGHPLDRGGAPAVPDGPCKVRQGGLA